MLYCFTAFNKKNKAEVNYALKNNSFIFFDKETKKFYDDIEKKAERKNISGETILPRTNSEEETEELVNVLLEMGATPLYWDLVKYKNISRWPTLRISDRRIIILRAEAFEEKNPQLEKMIDELSDKEKTIFLQTVSGSFSQRILKKELLDPKSSIRRTIAKYPNEELMISRPMHIVEDDLGKKEYSCVVRNGKIQSISRHTDGIYHTVEDRILEACKEKVQILSKSNQAPESYVLDVAEYEGEKQVPQIDVVKVKPIYAAALWLYNSLLDLVSDKENISNNIYEIDPIKKEQFMEEGTSPRGFATEQDSEVEINFSDEFTKTFEKYEKQRQQQEKKQQQEKPWSLSNWIKGKEKE